MLLDLQSPKIRTWLSTRLESPQGASGEELGDEGPDEAESYGKRPSSRGSSTSGSTVRRSGTVTNASATNSAKLKLGLSLREVEILFEDVTFEEVEESYALVEPIVKVLFFFSSLAGNYHLVSFVEHCTWHPLPHLMSWFPWVGVWYRGLYWRLPGEASCGYL